MSVEPGVYRHFKGARYFVSGVAVHSQTRERMVVYLSMETGVLWVRPETMFVEEVEYKGKKVPRFECIEDEERRRFSGEICGNE